jgi:hypothetical protein
MTCALMRCTPMGCTPTKCTPMRRTPVRYMPVKEAYREGHSHKRYAPRKTHARETHAYERRMPTRDACLRETHAYERRMPTRDACLREMHAYEGPVLRFPTPDAPMKSPETGPPEANQAPFRTRNRPPACLFLGHPPHAGHESIPQWGSILELWGKANRSFWNVLGGNIRNMLEPSDDNISTEVNSSRHSI